MYTEKFSLNLSQIYEVITSRAVYIWNCHVTVSVLTTSLISKKQDGRGRCTEFRQKAKTKYSRYLLQPIWPKLRRRLTNLAAIWCACAKKATRHATWLHFVSQTAIRQKSGKRIRVSLDKLRYPRSDAYLAERLVWRSLSRLLPISETLRITVKLSIQLY